MLNLLISCNMKTAIFLVAAFVASSAFGQTIEKPTKVAKNSRYFPENEWYTIDGKMIYYSGEEDHVAELCWLVIYETDADWGVDEDARDHDTTVRVETADFTIDAPVWYLSNGYTLISINKEGFGRGMLVMKPTDGAVSMSDVE